MYIHSVLLVFKCNGKNLCIIYLLLQGVANCINYLTNHFLEL